MICVLRNIFLHNRLTETINIFWIILNFKWNSKREWWFPTNFRIKFLKWVSHIFPQIQRRKVTSVMLKRGKLLWFCAFVFINNFWTRALTNGLHVMERKVIINKGSVWTFSFFFLYFFICGVTTLWVLSGRYIMVFWKVTRIIMRQ